MLYRTRAAVNFVAEASVPVTAPLADSLSRAAPFTVRLDAVEKKRPTFGKGPSTWRYTFTDPETGKPHETADIEPGDFPFTVMGCSTIDATGRFYQASVGQTI